MAIKRIPNTFLIVVENSGEIFLDNQSVDLRIIKIKIKLTTIPTAILIVSNSAFNDRMVVKVPAPANKGNAIGTILPDLLPSCSSLKNRMPKVISNPIKKITSDPARAKEDTSIPNKERMVAPKKRKANIIIPAEPVASEGLIMTPSFFILMITGNDPMISMTENRIRLTEIIAVKFMSN